MSGQNFIVPPLSWDDVENQAGRLRERFGLENTKNFPIMTVIEKILDQKMGSLRLEVQTKLEMGDAEGYTDPQGDFIRLREDVYEGAWKGDGRARFTAAHELGHWILHTNMPLARAGENQNIPAFRLSEPQANQFAGRLLIPSKLVSPDDTPMTIMMNHGVSSKAAIVRLHNIRK